MELVREVGGGIYLIDTCMGGVPEFTAVYLVVGKRSCMLVDSGPSTGVEYVIKGLGHLGVDPEDVGYVLLTHVHLDHAGGIGDLLEELPGAVAMVRRGMESLISDPGRLVESARRALGPLFAMYGEMRPVAPDRLWGVEEEVLDLGGRRIRVFPTPGHSRSHLCALDETTATLFCGDSLGMFLADEGKVLPVTPPPDFDLEEQRSTLEKLAALGFRRACFSHFGWTVHGPDLVARCRRALERMVDEVRRGLARQLSDEEIAEGIMRLLEVDTPYGEFMFRGMSLVSVKGIMRYLRWS
ncbi:MAG: MBL fold metallo-hydrolase [Candidatus Geothermincolales bacterium]